MAESAPPRSATGPALGSTADETAYVPVSWLAVAAAASAGLFGFLLLVMGALAARSHRPLLEEELLVLAVVAVVLSFAARRVIRNSEGTRTGVLFRVDLPNFAWWGGLILGLGYVSYLLAIEFSIRKDAQSEVQSWSDWVMKGDDESMNRAFHRTQDPTHRKNESPTAGARLEARWGKEYIAFRQSDLRRLIARAGSESCRFEIGGLREWKYQPTGIDCLFTATLTCPEGTFPLLIPMRGQEGGADAGRQWQIMHYPSAGYIDKERVRLTPYGWQVAEISLSGAAQARALLDATSGPREARATVLPEFSVKGDPKVLEFYRPLTIGGAQCRSAITGFAAAVAFSPGPEFFDYAADQLFRLPGGDKPDATRLKAFKQAWNEFGIVRAGQRLRESTDTNESITIAEKSVLFRMPIEIPLSATKGEMLAARGGAVLECTDPELLADLNRLRSAADPAAGTDAPPATFGTRAIAWRLVRIESDMKPIRMEPPKGPPPPGPPPGGPGG